jgi:hypothetical protein
MAGTFMKKKKNWEEMEKGITSMRKSDLKPEELLKSSIENLEKKYTMGKSLGQGAFGEVLECWLKGSDGSVKFALKKMKKSDDK